MIRRLSLPICLCIHPSTMNEVMHAFLQQIQSRVATAHDHGGMPAHHHHHHHRRTKLYEVSTENDYLVRHENASSWTDTKLKPAGVQSKRRSPMTSVAITAKKLQTLTKQELIEKCRERNVNCYGTKFDMVQRLLSSDKEGVVQKIKHEIPPIRLEKDAETGLYLHKSTSFLFDPTERKVVGRRGVVGEGEKILPLRYKDIQVCLRYKFRYVLPTNLAEKPTVDHPPSSREEEGNSSTKEDDRLKRRLEEIQSGVEQHLPEDEDEDEEEEEVEDDALHS